MLLRQQVLKTPRLKVLEMQVISWSFVRSFRRQMSATVPHIVM